MSIDDTKTLQAQASRGVTLDAVTLELGGGAPSLAAPLSVDFDRSSFEGERYETVTLLGQGGMGEVRLCRDKRIGREVAMKVIREGQGSQPSAVARFAREARVQGQLEHPSVVPVYDLGVASDGQAFFTMKRVRGRTLLEVLEGLDREDPVIVAEYSQRKLLTAMNNVCLAVAFAHDRGVVHRDLKPANVMLGAYGEVNVLDWGLAKLSEEAPDSAREDEIGRTAVGEILGTPGYMAPEQASGAARDVDARADVYALGVILFEILALEPLHPRGAIRDMLLSAVKGVEARPSVRRPDRRVSPELDAICARATALAPHERYANARELALSLERYLDGDRDLERRKQMAEQHAAAAERAARQASLEGEGAKRAREIAMREASSALALDPEHPGARATLVKLLLEPPKQMPPEARAEFERSRTAVEKVRRKSIFYTFALWLLFAPFTVFFGILSWKIFGFNVAVLSLGTVLAFAASRGWIRGVARLSILVAALVQIMGTAFFVGPLMLAPGLAAAVTLAYVITGEQRFRRLSILLGVLAISVPWALQKLGWVDPSYAYENGRLVILPIITKLPENIDAFLLVISLTLIAAPAFVLGRVRDHADLTEERLFLHAWNLRQLLPAGTRVAATTDSPAV